MNDFHYNYTECSNMNIRDHESSACVEKIPRCERDINSNQHNIHNPAEFVMPTEDDNGFTTKTGLKRMAQANPAAGAALKPSKEPAEQHEAGEDPNENSLLEPITIADPELFTVLFTYLRDNLESSTTNRSLINMVRQTLIMNDKVMKQQAKIIVELRASLAAAKVNKISEKDKEKRGNGDGDHEIFNIKRFDHKPFVLPPEYDENDSRWTLKHHKLEKELVELMPNTDVYIDAVKLIHCKRLAKNCKSLAGMLTIEIFRKSALTVCSLTGSRARAYDLKGKYIRPGLDENARLAIEDFVEECRREKRWKRQENQSTLIRNGIRNIMRQIRLRFG